MRERTLPFPSLIPVRYFFAILFLGLLTGTTAVGATKLEERALKHAITLLENKFYAQAEQGFDLFLAEFPESTNKVTAILHQAQARFYQSNFDGALELLRSQLSQAGGQAHEYQYWIAHALFQKEDYRASAKAFSELYQKFPNSSHELEATFYEALAESKLAKWPRVIELLNAPAGKFQIATRAQPNSPFTVDGNLLLAEALLKRSRLEEAKKVIAQLENVSLVPEANWRKMDLLCRIQLAAGDAEKALETTTNLLAAATETGQAQMFAESVLLRGEIFQTLNRIPEAIEVLEKNVAGRTNIPVEIRRNAFFKLVNLNLAQGQATNAMRRLESFIDQNPKDPSMDLALVTLGELRLKEYVVTGDTNVFNAALTNFQFVITNFPQSTYLGKAHLNRGWCHWLRSDFASAEADFLQAASRLPVSEDKAIARFKLADSQFRQGDYAGAAGNYQLLIQNHSALERVTNSLFEPALHQIVRAALEMKNVEIAKDGMQKLWDWFPRGSLGDRTLLLVGGEFNRTGNSAAARELFSNFLRHVPDSARAAEIKLALAQTYVQEKNWPLALDALDSWVTNYASHPLLPEGEFSRALTLDKAGQATNAFNLMTNFVARFPSNELAALAQNWVADFYWNNKDFRNAEKAYQELYQKFKAGPELAYPARLMAGRAAYERSDYAEAANYFKALVTDLVASGEKTTNSAASFTDEAWFALGDTLFQDFLSSTNEAVLAEAITAFSRITKDFATNAMAQLAWGRIGDCYFQLGAKDPVQYVKAAQYYSNVVYSVHANVASRSRAEVGLGHVCLKQSEKNIGADKQRLIERALDHYLNVVMGFNLRDGERFDPKWTYESGVAAARICENSQRWEQALNVYNHLAARLPSLRPALEKKIAAARTHLAAVRN